MRKEQICVREILLILDQIEFGTNGKKYKPTNKRYKYL